MTSSPSIDQLAAQVRDRAAASAAREPRPHRTLEHIVGHIAQDIREQLGNAVTDEQIGAVLLAFAGHAGGIAERFGGSPQAMVSVVALTGERFYHGTTPAPCTKPKRRRPC